MLQIGTKKIALSSRIKLPNPLYERTIFYAQSKDTYEQYTTEQLTFSIEELTASFRGLEKVDTEFGIFALVHS
ncbi:hypothetical protein DV702_09215 [Sporosarcina sp. PTS2304]|nr:hypothetical protein DV702_09215 [Sporosarcina sp. PTS2304]